MIGGSRALLTVLLAWNVGMLAVRGQRGRDQAGQGVVRRGRLRFGLLVGSAGLGVVLGGLSAGTWVERRGAASVYGFGLLLMAIGIAAAALSPNVWWRRRCRRLRRRQRHRTRLQRRFVQRGAPDRLRGRVFTVLMSSNYAVFLLGMLAAGAADGRVRGSVGVGSVRGVCRPGRSGRVCPRPWHRRADDPGRGASGRDGALGGEAP